MIGWFLAPLLLASLALAPQDTADKPKLEKVESSRCHVFIDYQNVWTLELVESDNGQPTPILNIIAFGEEEYPFRPADIHIYNQRGQRAKIEKFSIDTGVDGDPYITNFLNILQNSFIGMDLVGDFGSFDPPSRVAIELGEDEFQLQSVDCMDYDMLAGRIDNINFNSPNIKEDFDIVKIELIGKKTKRRTGRK